MTPGPRGRLAVPALVAVALAAAACGNAGSQAGPPKLPAPPAPRTITVATGAEPEGTLDLLAPRGAFPLPLLERFTRQNGCLVSLRDASDPGRLAGLLGQRSRPVDVVAVRSDRARELIDDGLVAGLDRHQVPSLSQLW